MRLRCFNYFYTYNFINTSTPSVKCVLQADIIPQLAEYICAADLEVCVLALATFANILSYSDTLLLSGLPSYPTLSNPNPNKIAGRLTICIHKSN